MAAARCFSSDSFPKVLYNWKDYLLYITDKDEMPDFTILNHTKLLWVNGITGASNQAGKEHPQD